MLGIFHVPSTIIFNSHDSTIGTIIIPPLQRKKELVGNHSPKLYKQVKGAAGMKTFAVTVSQSLL